MPAVQFSVRLDLDPICLFLDGHDLKPVLENAIVRCGNRISNLRELLANRPFLKCYKTILGMVKPFGGSSGNVLYFRILAALIAMLLRNYVYKPSQKKYFASNKDMGVKRLF
jgi:hypothetical protein